METDTNSVTTEKDYIISGFKTWLPVKMDMLDKARLIVLTKKRYQYKLGIISCTTLIDAVYCMTS